MGKVRLKALRNWRSDEHYPSIIALRGRRPGATSHAAHAFRSPWESPRRLCSEDARTDLHSTGYHRARGRRALERAEEPGVVQRLGPGLEPRISLAEHAPGRRWRGTRPH